MSLIEEVCSEELSKKLYELGLRKWSLFCWNQGRLRGSQGDDVMTIQESNPPTRAYTVNELGKMLPNRINVKGEGLKDSKGNDVPEITFILQMYKCNDEYLGWVMNYVDEVQIGEEFVMTKLFSHNAHDKSEANARAKLLIWLIESKMLELPK